MPHHTSTTWILIADAAKALIYTKGEDGKLHLAHEPLLAEAEVGYEESRSAALGRVQESATVGRHMIEPRTDEKTEQMEHFSRTLARILEQSAASDAFTRLVIAAPPRMLGHLREQLSRQVQERVLMELDKNYTNLPVDEIYDQIKAVANI